MLHKVCNNIAVIKSIDSVTYVLSSTRLSNFDTVLQNACYRDCSDWCLCSNDMGLAMHTTCI